MDLSDASVYFDDDPVYDGYTGAFLFNAQTSSFDDHTSDGATNRRRVLSLGPGLSAPARNVISLYGDRWLLGVVTPDSFYGEVVRQHLSMKRVTDLMSLLTPNQLLTAAAGTSLYAHKFYFKDTVNGLSDAEVDTFWNIFVSPAEAAAKGSFFKDSGGRIYRVRNDYLPVEGLRVCQADSIDGGLVAATWKTGSFDPITDTVSAGTSAVNVLMVEPSKFYRFRAMSDPSLQKGDMEVFVPTTITPKQGGTFTVAGQQWRVMTVQAELDAWVVHARLG